MYKYSIYIGLNDKDKHKQVIKDKKAINIIQGIMKSENIEGFTIKHNTGYWQGELENSKELVIYDNEQAKKRIVRAIRKIKLLLNQQEVILEITQPKSEVF